VKVEQETNKCQRLVGCLWIFLILFQLDRIVVETTFQL